MTNPTETVLPTTALSGTDCRNILANRIRDRIDRFRRSDVPQYRETIRGIDSERFRILELVDTFGDLFSASDNYRTGKLADCPCAVAVYQWTAQTNAAADALKRRVSK